MTLLAPISLQIKLDFGHFCITHPVIWHHEYVWTVTDLGWAVGQISSFGMQPKELLGRISGFCHMICCLHRIFGLCIKTAKRLCTCEASPWWYSPHRSCWTHQWWSSGPGSAIHSLPDQIVSLTTTSFGETPQTWEHDVVLLLQTFAQIISPEREKHTTLQML